MDKQHYVLLGFEGEVLAIVAGRHEAELKTYTRKAVAEHFQEPVHGFKVTEMVQGDDYDFCITLVGPQSLTDQDEMNFYLIPAKVFSK